MPWARATVGVAEARLQRFSRFDLSRRARGRSRGRRALLRGSFLVSTPGGIQHFSVDAIAKIMLGEVIPEKTGSRVVQQRKTLFKSVPWVLRVFAAAIDDGPDLFNVVGLVEGSQ